MRPAQAGKGGQGRPGEVRHLQRGQRGVRAGHHRQEGQGEQVLQPRGLQGQLPAGQEVPGRPRGGRGLQGRRAGLELPGRRGQVRPVRLRGMRRDGQQVRREGGVRARLHGGTVNRVYHIYLPICIHFGKKKEAFDVAGLLLCVHVALTIYINETAHHHPELLLSGLSRKSSPRVSITWQWEVHRSAVEDAKMRGRWRVSC